MCLQSCTLDLPTQNTGTKVCSIGPSYTPALAIHVGYLIVKSAVHVIYVVCNGHEPATVDGGEVGVTSSSILPNQRIGEQSIAFRRWQNGDPAFAQTDITVGQGQARLCLDVAHDDSHVLFYDKKFVLGH